MKGLKIQRFQFYPALIFTEHKLLNVIEKEILLHCKAIFGAFFNSYDSII
jgi:hypothetical protein